MAKKKVTKEKKKAPKKKVTKAPSTKHPKHNKTSFKKGNKASISTKNRKGATRLDREALAVKKIDANLVTRIITLNSHLSPHELTARLRTEYVSMLEAMVIKAMIKCYNTGDVHSLNFFFDRLVGKVPNHVKHEVANPYEGMTDAELLAEKERLQKINRDTLELEMKHNPKLVTQEREVTEFVNGKPEEGSSEDS